jgi:hypothetical protein
MAVVAHLVERVFTADNNVRNGIRNVIIAIDAAVDTTDALVRARARTVLVADGHDLPVGYFNANRAIATVFDTTGEHVTISGEKITDTAA